MKEEEGRALNFPFIVKVILDRIGDKTNKVSRGIFIHFIAGVARIWSRDRWGTTPRGAETNIPGVGISIGVLALSRRRVRCPKRGPKVPDGAWLMRKDKVGLGRDMRLLAGVVPTFEAIRIFLQLSRENSNHPKKFDALQTNTSVSSIRRMRSSSSALMSRW